MMNFDFHNLLFPEEFERFCRDVLEIREHPIKFTTYSRSTDGGIDIKSTNTKEKIIGQCKLYNPNNYSNLKAALNREIQKCKRQKPDRYILCTNFNLSPAQAEEIRDLFQPYILEEEDIIDGEKLNKYLGRPEYHHLLKTYSKLLVPNLNFIELALENILNNTINKKYYNQTESFLRGIEKEHKLYHNTKILEQCINTLEKNNVLILTGNPGVGKTTTAKMMANYFLHQKVKNILFLSNLNLTEIEGLLQDNQIIILDDFWGQNFSPSSKDSSMLRNFTRITNDYKNSSSRYLILTSREYIIKDVLNNAEYETKSLLDNEKYVINLDNYSEEEKVRIFLNHLLYYNFEKEYFSRLKYDNVLENIIHHQDYSPRHIEYFIKQCLDKDKPDIYHFFRQFLEYLDNPQEYWNNHFNNLNHTSQLILLITLISSDPIDILDLKQSFDDTQEAARRIVNKNIKPTEFDNEIKLLEDFYLTTDKQEYSDQILVQFQSPGIKDFLLEYLRTVGKSWIKPLIENVPFFNQLNFVFSTEIEEIDDYDSEVPLFGKKITLSEQLQAVLKNKLLTEFDRLNFCTHESRDFTDQFTRHSNSNETKYWKLILLNRLFDLSKNNNEDVRTFTINEVQKDIGILNLENRRIVNMHSMPCFPRVIKLINPYIELDHKKLISDFYSSITFTKEFDTFYEFEEIFPTEFKGFIKKNIIKIRKSIRYWIINDIDYYECNEMDVEFDHHLEHDIKKVCKKYGVRLTSNFVNEIKEMTDRTFPFFPKGRKQKKLKTTTKKNKNLYKQKFKPKKFDKIIDEYLPEDLYDEFNALQYLKSFNGNRDIKKSIRKDLNSAESILKVFTENQIIFSAGIDFISEAKINVGSYNHYTILASFFSYYCNKRNIVPNTFKVFFIDLAKGSVGYDYSITKTQLKKIFNKYSLSKYDYKILNPIIISDKNWYKFSSDDLKIYFIIEYLSAINNDKKFKEKIIKYSLEIYEPNILKLLGFTCKNRLLDIIVIPELERFLSVIDDTSEKSTVLSFINFFKLEVELEWDKPKKSFELSSSANSESLIELVIQYLGIEFTTMDFNIYFSKECFSNENIKKFFIEPKVYNTLYKRIIKTIPPKKGKHILTNEEVIYFDINLYDFMAKSDNYEIMREIGLEKYILKLLKDINVAFENIRAVNPETPYAK